jgi:esterase
MSEPRAHDLRVNGIRVRAWEWSGPPPAALLLHGIGNYGRFWDLVADQVAGRLRLIAPDARGHGDSDRPADGYTAEDYVADALAVADALELGRFVLVGHSMGGSHAIVLAARHAERVQALVIVDVGPAVLAEGRDRALHLLSTRPARFDSEADALAYLRETSVGYSEPVYENRMRWAFARSPEGGLVWRAHQAALLRTLEDRARSDRLWDLLAGIGCPTTVLRGTRSYVLGPETARRMIEVLPRGRLIEVDSGHNLPLERPRETAEAILEAAGRTRPRQVVAE